MNHAQQQSSTELNESKNTVLLSDNKYNVVIKLMGDTWHAACTETFDSLDTKVT